MYIIGLNGSPRRKGNTASILDAALKSAEELGAQTEKIFVHELMKKQERPFCVHCENPCGGKCYKGTDYEDVLEKLSRADGLLVASPVYFGDVSGQLKSFWDKTRRLRRENKLLNTVGAALAVGAARFGGQETTLRSLHSMMFVQGMIIVGDSHEKSPGHHGVCAQEPSDEDAHAMKRAFFTGKRLAEVCKATVSLRRNNPQG